jgi:hypothetical protein
VAPHGEQKRKHSIYLVCGLAVLFTLVGQAQAAIFNLAAGDLAGAGLVINSGAGTTTEARYSAWTLQTATARS